MDTTVKVYGTCDATMNFWLQLRDGIAPRQPATLTESLRRRHDVTIVAFPAAICRVSSFVQEHTL
jgi:hypothetical protein